MIIFSKPLVISAFVFISVLMRSTLSASTILMGAGVVEEGALWVDNDINSEIVIDSTQLYLGENTIRFSPLNGSRYRSGGLSFYSGNSFTVPEDETAIQIAYFAPTANQGSFFVGTDAGGFNYGNANSTDWTVNGAPGSGAALTANTWHTVVLDLTAISGFTPGTSKLNGQLVVKNGSGTESIFLGEIKLIPEPGTLSLLGLSALSLLLCFRRRPKR
ncbi:PEP-CTERM sorting domain-containing protein [Kiritimatiellota bacterium B12222]|nr:PEP-CTERM sorting domain-containing protein [Kiritimatiellota bacterium B12222]